MWEATTICPRPLQGDLLTLKVASEWCDVGYLCANFSLPRPLCSRLRPDVRDKETSDIYQRPGASTAGGMGGMHPPHHFGQGDPMPLIPPAAVAVLRMHDSWRN